MIGAEEGGLDKMVMGSSRQNGGSRVATGLLMLLSCLIGFNQR